MKHENSRRPPNYSSMYPQNPNHEDVIPHYGRLKESYHNELNPVFIPVEHRNYWRPSFENILPNDEGSPRFNRSWMWSRSSSEPQALLPEHISSANLFTCDENCSEYHNRPKAVHPIPENSSLQYAVPISYHPFQEDRWSSGNSSSIFAPTSGERRSTESAYYPSDRPVRTHSDHNESTFRQTNSSRANPSEFRQFHYPSQNISHQYVDDTTTHNSALYPKNLRHQQQCNCRDNSNDPYFLHNYAHPVDETVNSLSGKLEHLNINAHRRFNGSAWSTRNDVVGAEPSSNKQSFDYNNVSKENFMYSDPPRNRSFSNAESRSSVSVPSNEQHYKDIRRPKQQEIVEIEPNLRFIIKHIEGDGNCFFTAVADEFFRIMAIYQNSQLRKSIMYPVPYNSHLKSPSIVSKILSYFDEKDFELALRDMVNIRAEVAKRLRELCVQEWTKNESSYLPFLEEGVDFSTERSYFSSEGFYSSPLGDLVPLTVANIFNACLVIIRQNSQMPIIKVQPFSSSSGESIDSTNDCAVDDKPDYQYTVNLLYRTFGGGHYDVALLDEEKSKNTEKNRSQLREIPVMRL